MCGKGAYRRRFKNFCGTAVEIAGIKSIDETVFPLKWQDSLGATLQRTYKCIVLEKQNYEVII